MGSLAEAVLVLQAGPPVDPSNVDVTTGLGGGAVGAFLTTLVVGALLLVLAPEWTRDRTRAVADDAIGSFVYGVLALLVLVVVVVLLFVTLLGIPVAILLGVVVALVWAVGAVVGYLAIADRLLGPGEDRAIALAVAALGNAVLTLTAVGALLSFCIGAAGFGAVLRGWLD